MSSAKPVSTLAKLIDVPALPRHLVVPTDWLNGIRQALGDEFVGPIGITSEGIGGIGKTVRAKIVARDEEIRRMFPDGIAWVTIGEHAGDRVLHRLQQKILRGFGQPDNFADFYTGKSRLAELLREKRALVILDDVCRRDQVEAFDALGPQCRMILTTRDSGLIRSLGGREFEVELPTANEARLILAEWAGTPVDSLPPTAARVIELCGNLPLELALCGAAVQHGMQWDQLAAGLEKGISQEHRAIAVAIEALPKAEQDRFTELSVLPQDRASPEDAILTLWSHPANLNESDSRQLLDKFNDRALVTLEAREGEHRPVSMHTILHRHAAERRTDRKAMHQILLNAYRSKCSDGQWPSGPNDGYFLQNLANHLIGAGRGAELCDLLLELRWLQAKAEAGLMFDLQHEYNDAAAAATKHPQAKVLALLRRALGHSASTIAQHPRLLLQCLWHICYWHDSPQTPEHCLWTDPAEARDPKWPWNHPGPRLCDLMLQWAEQASQEKTSEPWLKSARPGGPPLSSALQAILRGHDGGVLSVAMTPNGRRIVSGSWDKTVRIWEAATGRELAVLRGHEGWVESVAITPDGRRIVSGSADKTVRIWETQTGRELAVLRGHDDWVSSVAITSDGKRIVSGSWDKTVRIWDTEASRELAVLRGHGNRVTGVAISGDGRRVVSGSWDKTVRLWEADTGREVAVLSGHEDWVTSVAMSSDGRRIVSGADDKTARVWEADGGRELAVLRGHDGWVWSVAMTPDGQRVVTGSWDKSVRLWEASTGRELAAFHGHEDLVTSVAATEDGSTIVSASDDKTVRVWESGAGHELPILRGHEDWVETVALTPDGNRIVSGSWDKTVRVWESSTGRELSVLRGHEDWVNSVAITPDGQRVVSGSWDKTVRVWEVLTGHELAILRGHTDWIRSVAITPDGRRVASGSADKTARLWDAASGRELAVLRGHDDEVTSVAMTSDGRKVVTGSGDKTARVWDGASGQELAVLSGHEDGVTSVAITPDGQRIVSGSDDGTVRVWESSTSRELAALRGHEDWVRDVAISADGRTVTSRDSNGRTLRWDLTASPIPIPVRPEVFWPGGDATIRVCGNYAAVVLVNDIIPCSIEGKQ